MKTFTQIRELIEGTLKVSDWSSDGGGQNPKKLGIKVKKVGSGRFGGDDVEMTGDDKKLIQFAQKNLGVSKKAKTLKDVQAELG